MKTLLLLITTVLIRGAQSAKILVVAPMPSYSHFSIPFALAKELAHRGHHITCISAYPQRNKIKNYIDVPVVENVALMEEIKSKMFQRGEQGILENLTSLFDLIGLVTEKTLTNKNVRQLLDSNQTFDVVIVEHFFNDALVGFGQHFKAPVILMSAAPSSAINNYIFANPAPKSYVPGSGGNLTKHMNFWERLQNVLMHAVFDALIHFYHHPHQKQIFNDHIAKDVDLDDVLYNTSLMLTNAHVSVSDAVPLVPNIIEVGGLHINPKPLPDELQSFLDNAKEGVVLFSMGSHLRSEDLKAEVKDGILEAFSKIKQKVLWKFETDLPNLPKNVKIMHWIPQQDILGHPNIRAFITHGGFLSNLEAVYHGVPIIGIPVFGDQLGNVAKAVSNGYALRITLDELSETKLSWTLNEILTNPKYKENVQQRSKLMHDQPLKPIDSAVYWVEHVIRYQGAPHLRSGGLDLKWYQREMIDIVVFLFFLLTGTIHVIYLAIRRLWQFIFFRKVVVIKSKNKQKRSEAKKDQ